MLRLQILLYELLRENQQRERSKITPHIHIRVKHPFLSQHHQSSLALLIVCLINCPCNCFCVHCVLLLFFFLYLYTFGVFLSSFSSIAHAAITNISLQFADMTSSSYFFDVIFFPLANFNYWSKFYVNIITSSGVMIIFFYIKNTPI